MEQVLKSLSFKMHTAAIPQYKACFARNPLSLFQTVKMLTSYLIMTLSSIIYLFIYLLVIERNFALQLLRIHILQHFVNLCLWICA
jgi:hypothetical protein